MTGATGSLGAHVVAQLIVQDHVKKVYCPVRASSDFNAGIRVIRSLRERSLYHNLPLAARAKIVALPSNFGDARLGLDEETYSQASSEITSLIHCAWSVNFNLGLGSFEADCIAGRQRKKQPLCALSVLTFSPRCTQPDSSLLEGKEASPSKFQLLLLGKCSGRD